MEGQVNLKGSTLAWGAFHPDVAVALFYDAVDSGESQPSAFSAFFGGEERFKDMGQNSGIHPRSGVGYGEEHVISDPRTRMGPGISLVQSGVGGLDFQLAAGGHGVTGIDRQIHDDLVDLALVGLHTAQFGI